MEPSDLPEEVQGLRLVRSFLMLPPEKRQQVLQFVDQLASQPPAAERHETENSVP